MAANYWGVSGDEEAAKDNDFAQMDEMDNDLMNTLTTEESGGPSSTSNSFPQMDDELQKMLLGNDHESTDNVGLLNSNIRKSDEEDGGSSGFASLSPRLKKGIFLTTIVALIAVLFVAGVIVVVIRTSGSSTSNKESMDTSKHHNNKTQDNLSGVKLDTWLRLNETIHSAMNITVDQCTDFYAYACDGWRASAPQLTDRPYYSKSFTTIQEANDDAVRSIIHSGWPLLKTYYESCFDEVTLDKLGMAPIQSLFQLVENFNYPTQIEETVSPLHKRGVGVLFDFGKGKKPEDPSSHYIAEISFGGYGLSVEQFTGNDTESTEWRKAYMEYIQEGLILAKLVNDKDGSNGQNDARDKALKIFTLEQALANKSLTEEELRDPNKLNNVIPKPSFVSKHRNFDFDQYFDLMKANVEEINSITDLYFEQLDALLGSISLEDLKYYFYWSIIRHYNGMLSKDFRDASFRWSQRYTGTKTPPPRWRTCVNSSNRMLGDLIGRYFVMGNFSAESKTIAEDMVKSIKSSFENELSSLPWMDSDTKVAAKKKLDEMRVKIGYPEEWEEFDGICLEQKEYVNNVMKIIEHFVAKDMNEIGKAVDMEEWDMYPQTVNAYYSPEENEMVFPAAILQNPVFDKNYPLPYNFGGIGGIIGHELTHGFDDQGKDFDERGRLKEWWTPTSLQNFNERAECIANVYDQYEVQPNLFLKGELTNGENIADIGGIKSAFRAMRQNAKSNPEAFKHIEEVFKLTNEQLFFVSWAQIWCEVSTPEEERILVEEDPHSPPRARVNVVLSQFEEFANAFKCPDNSAMKNKKCELW